jgi:dsRNA-specific ribonuclease
MKRSPPATGTSISEASLPMRAWIGDAVLTLWARLKILQDDGRLDGEKCVRMTSNQFLSALGEPTKVEAEIGTLYLQHGMEAAFNYVERNLLPVFERQERNRVTRGSARKQS